MGYYPILPLPLTLLFTFLSLSLGYTSPTTTLQHTVQTSRYTVVSSLLTSNQLLFNINYNKQFKLAPKCAVSIASIQYNPTGDIGRFQVPSVISYLLTYSTAKIYFAYTSVLSWLSIMYMAFDQSVVTQIEYYNHNFQTTPGQITATATLSTMTNTMKESSTHFMCFLNEGQGYQIISPPLIIRILCNATGPSQLTATIWMPFHVDGSINHPDANGPNPYKRVIITILVIIGDPSFTITSGELIATNSVPSGSLGFTIAVGSYFFIGFSQFSIPTTMWHFGLDFSLQQIQLVSPFNYLAFSFLMVSRDQRGLISGYLNNLETYIFESTVSFCYHGVENLSEIVTSQFTLNQTFLLPHSVVQRSSSGETLLVSEWAPFPPTLRDIVNISLTYNLADSVQMKYSLARVILILSIHINVVTKHLTMNISNTDNASPGKFSYDSNCLSLNNMQMQGFNAIVDFEFYVPSVGTMWELWYQDSGTGEKARMLFIIPNVIQMETTITSPQVKILFVKPVLAMGYHAFEFNKRTDCAQNFSMALAGDNIKFRMDYIFNKNPLSKKFVVEYIPSSAPNFLMTLQMRLITLVSVRTINNTYFSHLNFKNIENPVAYTTSCFTSSVQGLSFVGVDVVGDILQVTVQYNPSLNDTLFDIEVKESNTSYSVLTKDIKIFDRSPTINCTRFMNDINITLLNPEVITTPTLSDYTISLNNSNITINSVSITPNGYLLIETQYTSSVDLQQLQIHLVKAVPTTVYSDLITLRLQYSFPLYYCTGLFESKQKMIETLSTVLSALYLLFFVYASFCNSKLLAVETIFLIQMGYYSLIPVGLFCPPFIGLSSLRYSNGINPFFHTLEQKALLVNYSNLGIMSNFLSNINIMLILLPLCPLLYCILTFFGNRSNCYKAKPRLLKYGKSFLFQVPLTILLFNSFNIYSSLVVEIQSFGISNISSLAMSILFSLLLPLMTVVFVGLNGYFDEFRLEFDAVDKIGRISQKVSGLLRRMYPLVLVGEFILTPVLLSVQDLFDMSLYIVVGVLSFGFIYALVTTTYSHKIDNVRLFLHRGLMISLIIIQIAFKLNKNQHASQTQLIYSMPMILLSLLCLGVALNGGWIIYLSIKWFRKRGIIDHSLKIKIESTLTKPIYPESKKVDRTKWYPRLQFGEFKRESMNKRRIPCPGNKQGLEVQENYASVAYEENQGYQY